MLHMNNSYASTVVAGLLLCLSLCTPAQAKPSKEEPIIGAWTGNMQTETVPGKQFASNFTFFPGGLAFCHIDVHVQRFDVFNTPNAPTTFSCTVDGGCWKKTGPCKYHFEGVIIFLVKDENGNFQPFVRGKEQADLQVSVDTLTEQRTITFYEYEDSTLTKLAPVPPLFITGLYHRVSRP